MTHTAVVSVLIPLLAAAVLVLLGAADRQGARRVVSASAIVLSLAVSAALALSATAEDTIVYRVGGWESPFGILLVVDRLSAAMLVLADVVTLAAIAHALRGGDARGRHFHAFVHLQLAGVHGAFLTGDFFNLFVFFEVLLIASYCLLLHGKGAPRMRAAIPYVVANLIASTLFLVGLAVLYGSTGALNMAHVASRLSELPMSDRPLVHVAFALFAIVFALKAGVAPLHFWLTRAYPVARPEVATSFAIMTKVGVYCIVRAISLAPDATREVVAWLLPAALATQLIAGVGAVVSRELGRMQSYLLVSSVGVMLTGVLLAGHAVGAGLFYLGHSTVSVAAAFLVVGCIAQARRPSGDRIERGAIGPQAGALGACFLFSSIAVVGFPPLSGFLGKAALLAALPDTPLGATTLGVMLVSSLLGLVACARAASTVFWDVPAEQTGGVSRAPLGVPLALFAVIAASSVFAGPLMDYASLTEEQLRDRDTYVRAVLGAR